MVNTAGSYNVLITNPGVGIVMTGLVQFCRGGAPVQPSKPVTLKFPIPETHRADAQSLRVFWAGTEQSLAEVSASVEGNYLVIEPSIF